MASKFAAVAQSVDEWNAGPSVLGCRTLWDNFSLSPGTGGS